MPRDETHLPTRTCLGLGVLASNERRLGERQLDAFEPAWRWAEAVPGTSLHDTLRSVLSAVLACLTLECVTGGQRSSIQRIFTVNSVQVFSSVSDEDLGFQMQGKCVEHVCPLPMLCRAQRPQQIASTIRSALTSIL